MTRGNATGGRSLKDAWLTYSARRNDGPAVSFVLTWAAAFAFIAAWAIATPLFGAPDEPAHAIKARAVAGGQLLGELREGRITNTAPRSFAEMTRPIACDEHRRPYAGDCQRKQGRSGPGAEWVTNLASHYPPAYYAVVGWPLHLSSGSAGLYASRLLSAAIGALFIALAIFSATRNFGRLGAAAVVCAAMPSVLFLSGTINPNGLEATSGLLVWVAASGLIMGTDPSRKDVHLLGASAAVLVLVRPLSPLWLFIILAVMIVCSTRSRITVLTRVRSLRVWSTVLAVCLLSALAWTWHVRALPTNFASLSSSGATASSHWPEWEPYFMRSRLREMIGSFGWNDIHSPTFVYSTWLLLWVTAMGVVLFTRAWRGIFSYCLLSVGVFAGPALLDAIATPGYEFFWQGRYSLPIVVGIPILAVAVYVSRRNGVPSPEVQSRKGAVFAAVVVCVVMAAQIVALSSALQETLAHPNIYLVTARPVPVPSPTLVAVVILLMLCLAGSATLSATRLANRHQTRQSFDGQRPRTLGSEQALSGFVTEAE
jgi:hypothetical protein